MHLSQSLLQCSPAASPDNAASERPLQDKPEENHRTDTHVGADKDKKGGRSERPTTDLTSTAPWKTRANRRKAVPGGVDHSRAVARAPFSRKRGRGSCKTQSGSL